MPNHKSCVKRVKTSERERLRNRVYRSHLRTAIKDLRALSDREAASEQYKTVVRLLDKAAARNLIHKSNASRKKSRLALFVNRLG